LGATTGPEIAHQWSPPSRLPRFLSALALLLLLLPKRNRSLQALWVAVPLAFSLALVSLLWAITGIGSDTPEGLFEISSAVPFGLAAVWLLSPFLTRRRRFVTFLGVLATMELFSLFACAVAQPRDRDSSLGYVLIGGAVLVLLLSLAINLAGWSCRRGYDRGRLSLWMILWIMAGWLVVFVVMSRIERPGPLLEMATAFAIFCAISFGVLLPFLLLSFANAFYRERLTELLRPADTAPPSTQQPHGPPEIEGSLTAGLTPQGERRR
jgi:hypothetical protein